MAEIEEAAAERAVEDLSRKPRVLDVQEEPRKVVGLDIRDGQITRGYVVVHTVDADGQEIANPREVQMTEAQIAAFNSAMPGILAAK